MDSSEQSFFAKRERELTEDLNVLEDYIKNFWEVLPVPVCTTNPIFTILEIGKSFNAFLGYSPDEITGFPLEIIFAEQAGFEKMAKAILAQTKITDFECVLKTKTGELKESLVSAIVRVDSQGDVVGYIFSFVDITSLRKFSSQLKQKVDELERVNRLMVGREMKMVEMKKTIKKLQNDAQNH